MVSNVDTCKQAVPVRRLCNSGNSVHVDRLYGRTD